MPNVIEDPENTFRILIATDIHLGYAEKDAVRGDDSFITFEEILQIADREKVDFILLGGDLFHDGKPTVNSLEKCMSLLRHHCMGGRPIGVEFLSDPCEVFSQSVDPVVNYMDPNLNVAIPIFSIHGNHDDPTGYNAKCSLDMLSAAGLVNYFGRQDDLNNLEFKPLLFRKGTSYLALYGLGALKDKRLHHSLSHNKVCIRQPQDDYPWFNMFVLHQNRVAHKHDEYIPESFLPKMMDLILWGHEHECRIIPEFNEQLAFYVTQPGSSVVTSLSEGESKRKHVGILEIRNKKMRLVPKKLRTVRPFVFRNISLADHSINETKTTRMDIATQRCLEREIESMLQEAQGQLTHHPKQPQQPLLRLRVEYDSTDQLFNQIRFGLQFQGQVANPNDLILMKASFKKENKNKKTVIDEDAFQSAANLNLHSVEELIEKYFEECDGDQQMQVLSTTGMNDAMTIYLSKGDIQALEDIVTYQASKTMDYLLEKNVNEDVLDVEIEELRMKRLQQPNQETNEIREMLANDMVRQQMRVKHEAEFDKVAGSDEEDLMTITNTRGRGKTRARGASKTVRGGRGRARGGASTVSDDDGGGSDVMIVEEERPVRGRGSRGGGARASKAAAAPRSRGGGVTRGAKTAERNTSVSERDVSRRSTADSNISVSERDVPRRSTAGRNMRFLLDTDSDE